MSVKVKTPYYLHFRLPPSCVSCGGTPGFGMTFKVNGSKSDWSGKHTTTLGLQFPLCQDCFEVSQRKTGATWVAVLGVLGVIILCIGTTWLSLSEILSQPMIGWIIGFGLAAAWIVFVIFWAKSINHKGMTEEQILLRRHVLRSAKIQSFTTPSMFDKYGSIIFEFEDDDFASQFAFLNQAQIIR